MFYSLLKIDVLDIIEYFSKLTYTYHKNPAA